MICTPMLTAPILIGVSGKKRLASMASTSSKDKRPITLEEFGQDVLRRRAAAGDPEVPRNSGTRRTTSKRALLDAIAATGKRW